MAENIPDIYYNYIAWISGCSRHVATGQELVVWVNLFLIKVIWILLLCVVNVFIQGWGSWKEHTRLAVYGCFLKNKT